MVCNKSSPESVIYLSLNWILDNKINIPLDRRLNYHVTMCDNDYHPPVGIFPFTTSWLPWILVTMTVTFTFVLVIKLVTFTSHSADLCVTYGWQLIEWISKWNEYSIPHQLQLNWVSQLNESRSMIVWAARSPLNKMNIMRALSQLRSIQASTMEYIRGFLNRLRMNVNEPITLVQIKPQEI